MFKTISRNIFFIFTPLFVRRERIISVVAMRDLPPLMALVFRSSAQATGTQIREVVL